MTYGQLCPLLHSKGFALHNLASLPHISIAGAISTATHGSGEKNGNLATAVSALETDLRHTFASRLVMNGVDIFTVMRLMRHQSIQMTARYAHLADKHLKAAVEQSVTKSDTAIDDVQTKQTYVF